MNLKEFDAKQFLLEKGERVGLGVAVTLMVLMLIFSLFMPSKGFFSGSPAGKAEPLKKEAESLEVALRTRDPNPSDLPESTANRLIDLDTALLQPTYYETLAWFVPGEKENPMRRPPTIFNVVEAKAETARVPIDTYIFDSKFTKIMVLRDPDKKAPSGPAGGNNPLASMYPGGMNMPGMPGAGGGAKSLFNRSSGNMPGLQGEGGGETVYEAKLIPITAWNPSELTARQLMPARIAYIAGSFPYKAQLEEFKTKLKLHGIEEVLNETSGKGDDRRKSFNFLKVEVERMEVDAYGRKVTDWVKLDLGENYRLWLMNSGKPFEKADPKYARVSFTGLVAPLLREFHENRQANPAMMVPGMMPPGIGMPQPPAAKSDDGASDDNKTKYPDVAANLPRLQETLRKLENVAPKLIAAPPENFRDLKGFNPFNPDVAPPTRDKGAVDPANAGNAAEALAYPDYCLVRAIDMDIQPGKYYRYRLKIRMANPNYKRDDVASPAYKTAEELESQNWYEVPDTVHVEPELIYYVVEEKSGPNAKTDSPKESAEYKLWYARPSSPDSVVMQFHRWVESAPTLRKDGDLEPVGDWAIADRVYVARGEYVGRRVKVDLPVWKFAKNAFILPHEEQKKKLRPGAKEPTGIEVEFGQDNPEKETILVDFEGGKVHREPKLDDTQRLEVLMLDPDGKLLARNSAKDTNDEKRKDRRKKVLDRIKSVREGKSGE
jgi:hypothetical protein